MAPLPVPPGLPCDKPLTHRLEDALTLASAVAHNGLVFALTHNYTGYPMVRQAREMVASGALGTIRVVQVEYPQDWLTSALEETGQKQAAWRTDPARTLNHLLKQIGETTDSKALQALAAALRALAAKLTDAQAQQALGPLLKQIGETTDSDALQALAGAIQALPVKLTDVQAQQPLNHLLKQIGETTDSEVLQILAKALQVLSAQLNDAQAQQALPIAISSLAWAGRESEAVEWARLLVGLLHRATDQERTRILVEAIVYPFAAGPATEVLLDALRARTDALAKEVGMSASLAWIAVKYPRQAHRPACPTPPQPTSSSGLKCPVE